MNRTKLNAIFEEFTLETLKNTNIEIIARHLVNGFISGYHVSPYYGFSSTFKENREYTYGDPLKYINWKKYAHLNRLLVKRFEQESNMRTLFLLDISGSMDFPMIERYPFSKKIFSCICIAAMAQFLIRQNDSYGIMTFSDRIEDYLRMGSGSLHHRQFINLLNRVVNQQLINKKTSISKVLHDVFISIPSSSLVVIFSDLIEDYNSLESLEKSILHANHKKHYLVVFHVMDTKREVEMEGIPVRARFIDMEIESSRELSIINIKKEYIATIKSLINKIKELWQKTGMEYYTVDINYPPYHVLNTFYLARGKK